MLLLSDPGVIYITYGKSSEAALAIEEMNGKHMANNSKQLKVSTIYSVFCL